MTFRTIAIHSSEIWTDEEVPGHLTRVDDRVAKSWQHFSLARRASEKHLDSRSNAGLELRSQVASCHPKGGAWGGDPVHGYPTPALRPLHLPTLHCTAGWLRSKASRQTGNPTSILWLCLHIRRAVGDKGQTRVARPYDAPPTQTRLSVVAAARSLRVLTGPPSRAEAVGNKSRNLLVHRVGKASRAVDKDRETCLSISDRSGSAFSPDPALRSGRKWISGGEGQTLWGAAPLRPATQRKTQAGWSLVQEIAPPGLSIIDSFEGARVGVARAGDRFSDFLAVAS